MHAEPFNRSNAARSCYDEHIFEHIKNIFVKSWHLLAEAKDINRVFSDESLVIYDNNLNYQFKHSRFPFPMDYMSR